MTGKEQHPRLADSQPLSSALRRASEQYGYCTPHGWACASGGGDDPELAELDRLLSRLDASVSHAVIGDWERSGRIGRLAATIWGASAARISLGGSSASNHAVLGHVVPRAHPERPIILVDRQSHQSVHGGLIVSGLQAAWLERARDRQGHMLPLDVETVRHAIRQYGAHRIAALHHTVCAYGRARDPKAERDIFETCRSHGIMVCVDAAWAATHGLFDGLPDPVHPASDITILSPHKKGLTPQPIGVVLFRSPHDAERYDLAMRLGLATTSPNFALLAIAERRLTLLRDGRAADGWSKAIARASHVSRKAARMGLADPSDAGLSEDPTHVFLQCSPGQSGRDLANVLHGHGIVVEAVQERSVLLLFLPTEHHGDEALLSALQRFSEKPFGRAT